MKLFREDFEDMIRPWAVAVVLINRMLFTATQSRQLTFSITMVLCIVSSISAHRPSLYHTTYRD